MTVVRVKFLGALARLAGQRETSLAVDADATVADLLETMRRAIARAGIYVPIMPAGRT